MELTPENKKHIDGGGGEMSWLDEVDAQVRCGEYDGPATTRVPFKIPLEWMLRLISEARLMERIRQAEDDTHDLEMLGERVADIINADEQPDKEAT